MNLEYDKAILRRYQDEYTLTLYFYKSNPRQRIVKEIHGKHYAFDVVEAAAIKIVEDFHKDYDIDRNKTVMDIRIYLRKVNDN